VGIREADGRTARSFWMRCQGIQSKKTREPRVASEFDPRVGDVVVALGVSTDFAALPPAPKRDPPPSRSKVCNIEGQRRAPCDMLPPSSGQRRLAEHVSLSKTAGFPRRCGLLLSPGAFSRTAFSV